MATFGKESAVPGLRLEEFQLAALRREAIRRGVTPGELARGIIGEWLFAEADSAYREQADDWGSHLFETTGHVEPRGNRAA